MKLPKAPKVSPKNLRITPPPPPPIAGNGAPKYPSGLKKLTEAPQQQLYRPDPIEPIEIHPKVETGPRVLTTQEYLAQTSRDPPPPPEEEYTIEDIAEYRRQARKQRHRRIGLTGSGFAAFGIGLYAVMLWRSLTGEAFEGELPADLIDRFDKEAEGYDEKVGTSEYLLGLQAKRRTVTARASGHVLENAVGTGRNIPYYNTKQCETITMLDYSAPMLAIAKRKWKDEHPDYFHRVLFKQQSALEPITPPYGAQDGFDTVIQTMGLCSTPEPVKLLQNLELATKEDGGRILLLEHGKSHYDWLNKILDRTAPAHANEHGCWWNKDIGKIVEESGLEIVEVRRFNFGTTWYVELRPRKGMRAKLAAKVDEEPRETLNAPVARQRPWWSLWG